MSSLGAWEQQALESIRDGLAGSDPELATLLTTFTRLSADEAMPPRATLRARSRRAIQRSRRRARLGRAYLSQHRPGQAYHRLRSRHAVLTWLVVTVVMIGAALALSQGSGHSACSTSSLGAACASAAPQPGPPFSG